MFELKSEESTNIFTLDRNNNLLNLMH